MLENINEILEELNGKFADWQELLKKDNDFQSYDNEELKDKLYELVIALKSLCKENETNDVESFLRIFKDQEISEIMHKHVERTLIYYNAFKTIRKRSYQEPEFVKNMIEDIFNNFILRFDPDIYNRYEIVNKENDNTLRDIFKSMDLLTDYYVRRLLVQKEVEKDFEDETGLAKEICKFYADLFEKHFQELKLNYILNSIEICNSYMSRLEE